VPGAVPAKVRDLALDPNVRKTALKFELDLGIQLRYRQRPAFLFVEKGL